jgi:hypothetical protein
MFFVRSIAGGIESLAKAERCRDVSERKIARRYY